MVWNHFFMSGCLKSFLIFHMSLTTPSLNYSLQASHHQAPKVMLVATKQIMCIYLIMVLHLSKGILTVKPLNQSNLNVL